MEGKKFNSVTKVTTVNSNQSLLLTDQNGNVTSIGMDALKADLAVGQHAWCGRVWDTANATPKAASYIGSLELLKELPYILGLGAYLVKNDHSRRKLDSKDHHKYATGEPARLDGTEGHYQWGWGRKFYVVIKDIGGLHYEQIGIKPIPGEYNLEIPIGSISAAGNNSKKKKKLEEKRDKELAAAKSKANKKAMKIEIAQAIASTAMSAINAYASAAAIPTIGWTLAPIAAGMATAAGMIQLAAIKKQHQAEAAGYYEGGYTGGNRYRKEAGVVHEGEFVANHNAVNNSSIRPALDLIDRAQRSNTVGSLTADDITRSLGQGSSTVVAPVVNVNNDNTEVRQSLDGVNAAVSRLAQTLDDGIEVEVPISGRRGLHRRLQDYQRILNNK